MSQNQLDFIDHKKFCYKLLINKKYQWCYWCLPIFLLIAFLVTGCCLLSLNKDLIIPGIVFVAIAFLIVLIMFYLNYYYKKSKNKIKELFSIPNVLNQNLMDQQIISEALTNTEIYHYDYLSHFHHDISDLKDLKWHTKTYLGKGYNNKQDFLIRLSYIINFNDDDKVLLKSNKLTQIYLNTKINLNNKIIIIDNNQNNNSFNSKYNHQIIDNNCFFYQKEFDKNDQAIKKIIDLINVLKTNEFNYQMVIDDSQMHLYLLKKGNYLNINFENSNLNHYQEQINQITKVICQLIS